MKPIYINVVCFHITNKIKNTNYGKLEGRTTHKEETLLGLHSLNLLSYLDGPPFKKTSISTI